MIDRESRATLANGVRKLIDGELTNDDFDNLETLCMSNDEAIAAVWTYCQALYSSDLLFPYRLTGRYAPDGAVRLIANRCIAFLNSDYEYTWSGIPFMEKSHIGLQLFARVSLCFVFIAVMVLILGGWDWSLFAVAVIGSQLVYFVASFTRSIIGNSSKKPPMAAQESTWPFEEGHKQTLAS
jgi:hypothetical protein